MNPNRIKLEESWKSRVGDYFQRPEMIALREFLVAEKTRGKTIYPAGLCIFAALNTTPFEQVKVVILGQDPYHGAGQAHGLCFSVLPSVPLPPSLINIFNEIKRDLGFSPPDHGYLLPWAKRGVLLLNSVLTVEQGQPGSHRGKGWESFTDALIDRLNQERQGLVFMLWGAYAQTKGKFIDGQRHCVLKSVHPSPLSAHRGFIGCGHFSKANEYLRKNAQTEIDWSLPPTSELKLT